MPLDHSLRDGGQTNAPHEFSNIPHILLVFPKIRKSRILERTKTGGACEASPQLRRCDCAVVVTLLPRLRPHRITSVTFLQAHQDPSSVMKFWKRLKRSVTDRYRQKKTGFSPRHCFDQSQSLLLCLPPEIRLIVWRCVMAEHFILLYRKNGPVTYDFLNDFGPENLGSLIHITPTTICDIVSQINDSLGKTDKTKVLAVLQTCHMM